MLTDEAGLKGRALGAANGTAFRVAQSKTRAAELEPVISRAQGRTGSHRYTALPRP